MLEETPGAISKVTPGVIPQETAEELILQLAKVSSNMFPISKRFRCYTLLSVLNSSKDVCSLTSHVQVVDNPYPIIKTIIMMKEKTKTSTELNAGLKENEKIRTNQVKVNKL